MYYFDIVRATTTDVSAGTEAVHLLYLTAANQTPARIVGLSGSVRSTTAGAGRLLAKTGSTAGSGGTSQTPGERHASGPAASTAVTNDATAITPSGGTLTNRICASMAQAAAGGGWSALNLDHALTLLPNAGANGNMEVYSNAASNSMPIVILVEHCEG